MPKIKWREYIKGQYKIEDERARNKMVYDIRKRATRMMEDLLLICEKLPEGDKIRIFQNPRKYWTVMWPAMMKLAWEVGDIPQTVKEARKWYNSRETQELIKELDSHGIRYDIERLFQERDYVESKKDRLRIESQNSRKT